MPHTNRLIHETSPYLRQHAHNPVDWYAWGGEALAAAKAHDLPIFLSIGYSACHWCHVMERESFEDEETAAVMNAGFINIKVTREERPDLDGHLYGGGPVDHPARRLADERVSPAGRHPLSRRHLFPALSHQVMPSFRQVLQAVSDAYRKRRNDLTAPRRLVHAARREQAGWTWKCIPSACQNSMRLHSMRLPRSGYIVQAIAGVRSDPV